MCPRFAIRKGVKVLSRLDIMTPSRAQTVIDGLYRDVERRIAASPPGLCPVDMALSFLRLCHAQSCGKCVPCRIGLDRLADLLDRLLDGQGSRAGVVYQKLLQALDALQALVRRSKGRDNKTLGAMAEAIRKVTEKFEF